MNKKEILEIYSKGADEFALRVRRICDYTFINGRDIDEGFLEMPSSFRGMRDLNQAVKTALDETPLTVAERAALDTVAKEAERSARQVMQTACNDVTNFLTEKAKTLAIEQQCLNSDFKNLSSDIKDEVFELAWAEAYDRSHSEGFSAVMTTFSEVMDFAENVVKAIVSKGGKA